jgi:hypothetical protein
MSRTTGDAVRRGRRLGCVVITLALASGCQAHSTDSRTASITARVALFGGPRTPAGGMALNGSPAVGVNVTATAASGATWMATTDTRGEATLVVPPGSYEVFSNACGTKHVVAQAETATALSIECQVA